MMMKFVTCSILALGAVSQSCMVPTSRGAADPRPLAIKLPGGVPLQLLRIAPGTFVMGSAADEADRYDDEGPRHTVTVSSSFYLGVYEVTRQQWFAVMGDELTPEAEHEPTHPITGVSWDDCQVFLAKLNALGIGSFRLPSEAEWEYSCRAGTSTRFYWGDDPSETEIDQYAWHSGNCNSAMSVGTRLPNQWGFFDMSGNAWEWCNDSPREYAPGASVDPNETKGPRRVVRGGNWSREAARCRSAFRGFEDHGSGRYSYGFRLLMQP